MVSFQNTEEISNGGQFEVYSRFIESYWYQSELKITNVQKSNYGDYTCEVANENDTMTDTFTIKVDGTSIPDPPYDLKFVNSTHDSITISWKPGFDGGMQQKFTVILRKSSTKTKATYEGLPNEGTFYVIKGKTNFKRGKNYHQIFYICYN